ncbi:MAG: sigma-70 family RNA polymerase sigma factor, partial [Muribaculaceae bacterium]|nr:sigma-70 family RNA polymerase sigma factor [Muribaculaceae bacterium]
MEHDAPRQDALIAQSYKENFKRVINFIMTRVNNVYDAENLAQDVWVKLLTCGRELTPATITSFIFRIASNLVNDYLRHIYCMRDTHNEMSFADEELAVSPEAEVMADEIAQLEQMRVKCLPAQRRIIYIMSRYEDKTVNDIADELSLSFRTVENHLRMGRRDVRNYIMNIA